MNDATDPPSELRRIAAGLIDSYRRDDRAQHIGRHFVPSRDAIIELLHMLLELLYPGFRGRQDLDEENLEFHTGNLVSAVRDALEQQIERCLCHQDEAAIVSERGAGAGAGAHAARRLDVPRCREDGRAVASRFLAGLPTIRGKLMLDVQAAFDGDPAAGSVDEIILAYPGLLAVSVQRLAHELHTLGVPLMPRIMSEWAHTQTGCDIHPGAEIGDSFFIDHATGVVVGETATIGARVKLYQGVTLGALSLPHAARGARGAKRHPTVEDDVTIYANATVLGGDTVIGQGSVIGGGVFITRSVPPGQRVALEAPRLRVASRRQPDGAPPAPHDFFDFEI
ncbi:MAG: serine acetyltransferase [Myxococcales bacterium]|nr:serine acetyltransferase [Myxococcales bacterium]